MPEIQVTDQQLEYLKAISKEMATQDYCHTSRPLYAVYEKALEPNMHGEGSEVRYLSPDCDGTLDKQELVNRFEEEGMKNLEHSGIDEMAEEKGFTKLSFDEVDRPVQHGGGMGSQLYFTRTAAQEHIDANSYRYRKPFVYVVSAWRNTEMWSIMNLLYNILNEGEYHI